MSILRKMDPLEHGKRVNREHLTKDGWDDWEFPDTTRSFPRKPIRPDGDMAFRTKPRVKVPDSRNIIDFLKSTGELQVSTGSTRPGFMGATNGTYLNVAGPGDPEFTITDHVDGPKNLAVVGNYGGPFGTKIRIPKNAVVQGFPMNEYSDHKLHVVDIDRGVAAEIQFITDVSANPVLSAMLNFLALFKIGKGAGGLRCHGVKVYSLTKDSTDSSIRGSSAAKIPNIETTFRYEDTLNGWTQMTTMAVKSGKKKVYVYPAQGTDGPSSDSHAIKFGQLIKLSELGYTKLMELAGDDPILMTIVTSWYEYGIMAIDTGGSNTTSFEPDNRWPQDILKEFMKNVKFDLFEVWEW